MATGGSLDAPQASILSPGAIEELLTRQLADSNTSWYAAPMLLNARDARAAERDRYYDVLGRTNSLAAALARQKMQQEGDFKNIDASVDLSKHFNSSPLAYNALRSLVAGDNGSAAAAELAAGALANRFKVVGEGANQMQAASKAGTEAGTPFNAGQLSQMLRFNTGVGVNEAEPLDITRAKIDASGKGPMLRVETGSDGIPRVIADKLPLGNPDLARSAGMEANALATYLAGERPGLRAQQPAAAPAPAAQPQNAPPKATLADAPAANDPDFVQKVKALKAKGAKFTDEGAEYVLTMPDGSQRRYKKAQ